MDNRKEGLKELGLALAATVIIVAASKFLTNSVFSGTRMLDLHTLVKVACIFYGNISGAASAFYIIDRSLAEQGKPGAPPDRKDTILVFKKNHAFRRSPAR